MMTAQQRELRRKFICSSDAAAILDLDPFKSSAQVWLEKTGRVEDDEGDANTERGNLLEPAILNWAEKQIGGSFKRHEMIIARDGARAANLDGRSWLIPNESALPPYIVEAKSTVASDEYGEQGTDQIPQRVLVQVHHQMDVVGPEYELAWIPVLMPTVIPGGRAIFDFRMYRVVRNKDLAEMVAEACLNFMDKFVRTDTQPDDFRPSLEVLKRMRREPNKCVPIEMELVDEWKAADLLSTEYDKVVAERKAALIAALGDAEAGELPDGSRVTFMETHRKSYEVKETTFRTLRLVKASAKALPKIEQAQLTGAC